MEQIANSRFWRTIAVVVVVLLSLDVGHRLLASGTLPDPMPAALARSGGIVASDTVGVVTTNQDGTVVYRWGKIEGTPGGLSVVKFDLKTLSIDRLDLK
jgi:hypothetical protein